MKFTVQNFSGELKNGTKYRIDVREDQPKDCGGFLTITASLFIWKDGQWRYQHHVIEVSNKWKEAFFHALLRLETRYNIELIKLKL